MESLRVGIVSWKHLSYRFEQKLQLNFKLTHYRAVRKIDGEFAVRYVTHYGLR